MNRIFRKQVHDFFGPLNKAIIIVVKIFFITKIISFLFALDPVKIKMKNLTSGGAQIFIYNREGRAADITTNTELGTERFYQRCFPHSHLPKKSKYFLI